MAQLSYFYFISCNSYPAFIGLLVFPITGLHYLHLPAASAAAGTTRGVPLPQEAAACSVSRDRAHRVRRLAHHHARHYFPYLHSDLHSLRHGPAAALPEPAEHSIPARFRFSCQ